MLGAQKKDKVYTTNAGHGPERIRHRGTWNGSVEPSETSTGATGTSVRQTDGAMAPDNTWKSQPEQVLPREGPGKDPDEQLSTFSKENPSIASILNRRRSRRGETPPCWQENWRRHTLAHVEESTGGLGESHEKASEQTFAMPP